MRIDVNLESDGSEQSFPECDARLFPLTTEEGASFRIRLVEREQLNGLSNRIPYYIAGEVKSGRISHHFAIIYDNPDEQLDFIVPFLRRGMERGEESVIAAIGEPARSRMLCSPLNGHARTSTELAMVTEVTPSAASLHLNRLKIEKLVRLQAQGRRRY